MSRPIRPGRVVQVARCSYGLALLVAPERVIEVVIGERVDARVATVARVLGVRNLGQALLTGPAPGPLARGIGVAVDGLHAASMLALGALDQRVRGLALRSAGVASSWAVLGLLADRFTRD